jgi:hypothetical protein
MLVRCAPIPVRVVLAEAAGPRGGVGQALPVKLVVKIWLRLSLLLRRLSLAM